MNPIAHPSSRLLLLTASLFLGLAGCSGESGSASASDSSNTVVGTIEGTIGEQTGTWEAITMSYGDHTASTATWSSVMGDLVSYTVQGHEGATFSVENSVSISLSRQGERSYDPDVTWFPEASLAPNYAAVDGSVTISLDRLEDLGGTIEMAGTAKGMIYRNESFTSEPDMNDGLPVDLTFSATLSQEN